MADHDDLISTFADVTGVDAERAKFYLESSAWQLEVALASFYENDGGEMAEADQDVVEPSDSPPAPTVPSPMPMQKPKPRSVNTRFATVHSLNTASSDEEEGQAFYAGGSEHSGQQVIGPGKKKDIVEEMFKAVEEHGAEDVEAAGRFDGKASAFAGTGYKLGQSSSDTEVVAGASTSNTTPTDVVLKLWREGFSVNDGPLRAYHDPENKDFLESVRRGKIPQELIRQAKGNEVYLNMEDHRHEEFLTLKQKVKPFSGKGHTLGSPAPVAVSELPVQEEAAKPNDEAKAKESVQVNASQPSTNIQIRLADGSRLLGQFNHSHTVADIRRYIAIARPQYDSREFALMTTFPSRELSDDAQTVLDAGLLNAAILQRLK